MSLAWQNSFLDAKNWWNGKTYDLKFAPETPSAAADFKVLQKASGSTQWRPGGPNSTACINGFNSPAAEMWLSTSSNGQGGSVMSAITVVHELGHAGGLAHVMTTMSCSDSVGSSGQAPKSVMKSGLSDTSAQGWVYTNCNGLLPPYGDDVLGINSIYPGGL